MDQFAARLRQRAQELGISNAEAARRSGLNEQRYGHYVKGRREPDLATLVRIARALETTPDDLLLLDTTKVEPSRRAVLRDRLNSAAKALTEKDLELVVVQTEALAKHRRPR
jgi:transcriptional regulator with XRE-family HTH domain